jgi:hypothetical protein
MIYTEINKRYTPGREAFAFLAKCNFMNNMTVSRIVAYLS